MENLRHSEVRRLRFLLTKHNIPWSIDWSFEKLRDSAQFLLPDPAEKPNKTPQNTVLVTLFFEVLSFEYQVREISVIRGDPFSLDSPSFFLTSTPASPLVFWLPEVFTGLVVVVSLAPRGKFAVPLDDLLALDSPVESAFTLWESEISGVPAKIDSVRARLRASVQHPLPVVAPVGKSYAEVLHNRKSPLPVRAPPVFPASHDQQPFLGTAPALAPLVKPDWSRCSPELQARLERLRVRVSEMHTDNFRLSELLSRMPS